MLIATAWGFAAVLVDAGLGGVSLRRLDNAVYYLLQGLRTPLADAAMIAVSQLGDAAVTLPVVIAVLLWIAWKGAWRVAAYWLAAVAFAAGLAPILKTGPFGFGSAGSHAAMTVIVYGFLAVLLARAVMARERWLVAGVAVPLIALIAFWRLYLGAHSLSEVLGAFIFGSSWVALLAVAYVRRGAQLLSARSLAAVSLPALLLAGGVSVATRHSIDTERYAVRPELRALSAASWWEDEWHTLPAWRLDMVGADSQPMTVQWAGSPALLRKALDAAGWQTPPRLSAANLLLLLDTARSAMSLPVLPRVHDGRNAALTLSRPTAQAPDQRLVLRLWETGAMLRDSSEPIWAGTVTEETIRRPFGWYNLPHDSNDYNGPRDALRRALAGVMVREVQRSEKSLSQQSAAGWDGRVLLVMPLTATSRARARE